PNARAEESSLLNDLELLGEQTDRLRVERAPAAVHDYLQWSWVVAQESPLAFIGAAFALELLGMGRAKAAADNLRARAAILNIDNAVSFLDARGLAHPQRMFQLKRLLQQVEDPADQAAIARSATVTRTHFPRFFQSVGAFATAPSRVRSERNDSPS